MTSGVVILRDAHQVIEHELIEYTSGDQRMVAVVFKQLEDAVQITEIFDAEVEHSAEIQRASWQEILNNFLQHVEGKTRAD
ncbi:MAG: hypothetical protein ACEQSE_03590 [Candidatus Aquirickettsiella gammari]